MEPSQKPFKLCGACNQYFFDDYPRKGVETCPDCVNSPNKRSLGVPVEFFGWIAGDREDSGPLKALGVRGNMIWTPKDSKGFLSPYLIIEPHIEARKKKGFFEYCTITLGTAERLKENYPAFVAEAFTGARADGAQTKDQPLWVKPLKK